MDSSYLVIMVVASVVSFLLSLVFGIAWLMPGSEEKAEKGEINDKA